MCPTYSRWSVRLPFHSDNSHVVIVIWPVVIWGYAMRVAAGIGELNWHLTTPLIWYANVSRVKDAGGDSSVGGSCVWCEAGLGLLRDVETFCCGSVSVTTLPKKTNFQIIVVNELVETSLGSSTEDDPLDRGRYVKKAREYSMLVRLDHEITVRRPLMVNTSGDEGTIMAKSMWMGATRQCARWFCRHYANQDTSLREHVWFVYHETKVLVSWVVHFFSGYILLFPS